MADIDTISIFLTRAISAISSLYCSALIGLLIYFIIASKVVNDVSVIS